MSQYLHYGNFEWALIRHLILIIPPITDAATDNQPESVPAGSIQYIHAGNGQINPGPPPDTALSEKILIESASEKDRISDVSN